MTPEIEAPRPDELMDTLGPGAPVVEPPAPAGPDLSRWAALGEQTAVAVGLDDWQVSGTHPWHSFAEQRADRVGRNAVRFSDNPTDTARAMAPSTPVPGDGVDFAEQFRREPNPSTLFATRRRDADEMLNVPPDATAAAAHVAATLTKGRPDQALGFVEGIGQRLVDELPALHGRFAGEAKDPAVAAANVAAYELARFDGALDKLRGADVDAVRDAWGRLRDGELLSEDEGSRLASGIVSFARAASSLSDLDLRTGSMTMSVAAVDIDAGTLEFAIPSWEAKPLADLSDAEVTTRIAQLDDGQLLEAMVGNIVAFDADWVNEPGDPVPAAVTQVALGFATGAEVATDRAFELAAERISTEREPVSAAELAARTSAAWGRVAAVSGGIAMLPNPTVTLGDSVDTAWVDGAGPNMIAAPSIFSAVTGNSMSKSIPVDSVHVSAPMRDATLSDLVKPSGKVGGVRLRENGDGSFSAIGDPGTVMRGLHATKVPGPDGGVVMLPRRPSRAADLAKLPVPVSGSSEDYMTPPDPMAFQPGVFLQVNPLTRLSDGREAKSMIDRLMKDFEGAGIAVSTKGESLPHRARRPVFIDADGVRHDTLDDPLWETDERTEARSGYWFEFSTPQDLRRAWEIMSGPEHATPQPLTAIEAIEGRPPEGGVSPGKYSSAVFGEQVIPALAYVGGDGEAPPGAVSQVERHFQGDAGYRVTRTTGGRVGRNAVPVWAPDRGLARESQGVISDGMRLERSAGRWLIDGGTVARPGIGLEMRPADEMSSLLDVRVRSGESGQWHAPSHAWVRFDPAGTPEVTYGLDDDTPPSGPGLAVKVTRSKTLVTTRGGRVDTERFSDAVDWLEAHGVTSKIEEA